MSVGDTFLKDCTRIRPVVLLTLGVSKHRFYPCETANFPGICFIQFHSTLIIPVNHLTFCTDVSPSLALQHHWVEMSEEMWTAIPFPVKTVPKKVATGVDQHLLPHQFRALWSVLIYFQIYFCPYLCQILKISSTINILNFNYLLNIYIDKLEGEAPLQAEIQSS